MFAFRCSRDAYAVGAHTASTNQPVKIVPITEVEPFKRSTGVTKDFGGFERERMVKFLRGFVAGDKIPPVLLLPNGSGPYPLVLTVLLCASYRELVVWQRSLKPKTSLTTCKPISLIVGVYNYDWARLVMNGAHHVVRIRRQESE